MSEFKGTPGPWKIAKELSAFRGEWLISMDCGAKGQGIAIAETRTGPIGALANARLIAAAPDLLAALERLSGQCERLRLDGQKPTDAELNAVAVIKQATGAA